MRCIVTFALFEPPNSDETVFFANIFPRVIYIYIYKLYGGTEDAFGRNNGNNHNGVILSRATIKLKTKKYEIGFA